MTACAWWKERPLELITVDVGALEADRARSTLPDQVAATEQIRTVGALEQELRVRGRRNAEADPRREVAPQERRDHACLGALGGQHKVNARGACLGAQPLERALELLLRIAVGHQVGVLVEHDNQARGCAWVGGPPLGQVLKLDLLQLGIATLGLGEAAP